MAIPSQHPDCTPEIKTMRHARDEDGAALVVVLIFMTVFGLIISGLLTISSASFGFTRTVSNHESKVYAADAGVSFGIQQLSLNNELCPTTGVTGPAIQNLTVGGRNVSIACEDTTGSTGGADGWAIITTSTGADSLVLEGAAAANERKNISGPVFVGGGVDWGTSMKVEGGNFYQRALAPATACVNPPPSIGAVDSGDKLELETPPYGYHCRQMALPDPAHVPPVKPDETLPRSPTGDNHLTCRTFSPGVYLNKPVLVDNNYFEPGTYYFKFNDQILIQAQTVYGGEPGAGETRIYSTTGAPCAVHSPPQTGGVQWIFGGGSSLLVNNPDGHLELFRRTGEPAPATNNMSIVAVPNDSTPADPSVPDGPWTAAGWTPNSLPTTTRFIDKGEGTTPDMAIHGMIYAPKQWVALRATNTSLAQALGGIVAYKLTLMSSANVSGFAVSAQPGLPGDRYVLITACAPAVAVPVGGSCPVASGTERPVMSSAVVTIRNDAARTTKVHSWRTRGPSDS
jgi:hypothetical protein